MPDAVELIPEITDKDIDWVRRLLDLDSLDGPRCEFLKNRATIDVSACPGSGKTTLIVAKLAILARKWPYRVKGICVLSHTNVAREEIQHRLGGTVVGQCLLSYPHFIDTIHSFLIRYLALPWLRSNGFPVVAIDDTVTTAYRRAALGTRIAVLDGFLQRRRASLGDIRITGRDLSFGLNGESFPASESTDSFQLAQQAVELSAKAGYFYYDEVFVWAKEYLRDVQDASSILASRFPLVLIDEMQDTSDRQATLLCDLFPRDSADVVVQRVGDSNQAIFDAFHRSGDQADLFPDQSETRCINITNSYRFGPEIAALASPFAVQPVMPLELCGLGPKDTIQLNCQIENTIFLFPDDSPTGVLDAYGKHVLCSLPAQLLDTELVTAVGAVHRKEPTVGPGHAHYPKTVSHYWTQYRPEYARKSEQPNTLIQYIRMAQSLAREQQELHTAVNLLASSLIRLADRIGSIAIRVLGAHTHKTMTEALQQDPETLNLYRRIVTTLLADQYIITESRWEYTKTKFTAVASALCNGSIDERRANDFFVWSDDYGSNVPTADSALTPSITNVYRVTEGERHVDIRLGSIHSVKGQTHCATLVLNTYWNGHVFKKLFPWLLGERSNGYGVGLQNQRRLLQTYVAMTRPSHLLCLAMPRSFCSEGGDFNTTVVRLAEQGWQVQQI